MGITVKRPEKIVEFCTDLDLQADWEEAGAALRSTREKELADARMTGESKASRALKGKIRGLEARMQEETLLFRFRALPRKRWVELEESHPPRDDRDDDRAFGVNLSTFVDAVIMEPGSLVSVTNKATGATVEFDPGSEWMQLADDMSDAQWDVFSVAVYNVNQGRDSVAPGFNKAAWLKTRGSASK